MTENREKSVHFKSVNAWDRPLRKTSSLRVGVAACVILAGTFLQAQEQSIGVQLGAERFSRTYDAAQSFSLTYRQETGIGPVLTRMNYANRFQQSGIQVEIDGYPSLSRRTYLYLNYGYSGSPLFPRHRAGIEFYHTLPANLEASAGMRFLSFSPGSDVTLATASLALYTGPYYAVARVFLASGTGGTARSLNLLCRRFLSSADEYLFVRVGGGVSPDEQSNQSALGSQVYNLSTQSIAGGWQSGFHAGTLYEAQLGWTNQELLFSPGEFVQSVTLLAGVRFRL